MNLTAAVREKNLAAWRKQSPAVIKSPLRAIHEAFPDLRNEKGERIGEHKTYAMARRAAERGNGALVKRIARSIA